MAIADVTQAALSDLISLKGRSAVVTGGAQGLGKAMARRLAEAGASVLIGDLKADQARAANARQIGQDIHRRGTGGEYGITDQGRQPPSYRETHGAVPFEYFPTIIR